MKMSAHYPEAFAELIADLHVAAVARLQRVWYSSIAYYVFVYIYIIEQFMYMHIYIWLSSNDSSN